MNRTERIEAAARAMARVQFPEYDDDEFEAFWAASEGAYTKLERKAAEAALTAAFPQLMSEPPTGWVAPMEAKVGFIPDACLALHDESGLDERVKAFADDYRAMRDAHLKDNPS